MKNIKIFQIFYNEETKNSLDLGFLPLDNMANIRLDWREYWPIRNYLINNQLDENCLYGFFSPKFKIKTNLSSDDCFKFINNSSDDIDVFIFSPFYDLAAWFQNIFIQAIDQHTNSRHAIEGALKLLNPSLEIDKLVTHSGNNIFCNYFVAKPAFWRAWLENCELIWDECEKNISPIAKGLNAVDDAHENPAPIKTFVIERIASLQLATNNSWNVKIFNPFKLPLSSARISQEISALIQMDALKIAYASQGRVEYLNLFKNMADLVLKKLGYT